MTLSGRLQMTLSASLSASQGLGTSEHAVNEVIADQIIDGTTTTKMNVLYDKEHTIGAGASVTIDIRGGGLVDGLGNAVDLAKVRGMYLHADDENGDDIVFGGAATNPFLGPLSATEAVLDPQALPYYTLNPGQDWLDWNPKEGYGVVAATNDKLKFENMDVAEAAIVRVVLLGTTV